MTSLPIINQGRSYYAGDDRLTMDAGQIYKELVPVSTIALPSVTWTTLASTDAIATLSSNFTSPNPGELLYEGVGGYYQISYAISALMAITTPAVVFSIYINSVDSKAHVQLIEMDQTYKNVSASAIVLLETDDVISIKAKTEGANDNIEVQNIVIAATRILQ